MKRSYVVFVFFVSACLLTTGSYAQSLLQGSFASQEKQNREADTNDLTRIEDDVQLAQFKERGLLVKIPATNGIAIDARLDEKYGWVRPWTAEFLKTLGDEFYARFKTEFQINSATRTVVYQAHLTKQNGNAAPPLGPRRSSHLTGATIDIGKKNLRPEHIVWLRQKLKVYEKRNIVEATEEHHQAVFHVMVFKRYTEPNVVVASN